MSAIWIELTHPDAKVPTRATTGSACFDVYSCEDAVVEFGKVTIVDAGFRVHVPKGYELVVRPRSGMAFKHGITVVNSPGTIDSDYRGLVKVALSSMNQKHKLFGCSAVKGNLLSKAYISDNRFKIKKGDRIAQVGLRPVPPCVFLEHKVEDDTDRGTGGYGSTGK